MIGIGGLGSIDLSAGIGLSGISNVAGTPAAPVVSAPMNDMVASVGMSTNLQILVQTLQHFSLAEIMLALLLATNGRRCERPHEVHTTDGLAAFALASALSQSASLSTKFETSSVAAAVGSQSATMVNVAG